MKAVDSLLKRLGYVRADDVKKQLNFAYSIGKRLDEHRETIEAIELETDFFQRGFWRHEHAATQDDYLMRIYWMVHGFWPDSQTAYARGEQVRPRPAALRPCGLPEYPCGEDGAPPALELVAR